MLLHLSWGVIKFCRDSTSTEITKLIFQPEMIGIKAGWTWMMKLSVFTDGSRINSTGQAGAGVYNQTDCEEYYYPLGCRCSVFHAEIYAILQCARLHSLHCRNNASVAICSDSQAALKALTSPKVNSTLVAETVCALTELSVHNSVRLVWTPGHCGILGNEAADLSLIHIWRCRRSTLCRSRWSPYH